MNALQGPPAPVGAVLLLSADEDLGDTPLVGRGDAGEGPRRRGGVLRGLSGALDVASAWPEIRSGALRDGEPECAHWARLSRKAENRQTAASDYALIEHD